MEYPISLQQHLAAIVEDSNDAIITKNLDSIIQSWNRSAERLFGYTAEEAIGQPITILFPEGRQGEEADIIGRIRRGERIEHYETTRRRKDGNLLPISLTISPVRDASGRIVGASKIARDITLQHEAEEQQRLLLSEMRHRVGNCFAVASGLLSICARQADTTEELVQMVKERFAALSVAHSLAVHDPKQTHTQTSNTRLTELLLSILEPFVGTKRPRIEVEDCPVVDAAITPFALVFYELCTNALKYGALSQPEGELAVSTERRDDRLRIIWAETCRLECEDQAKPRLGFGTRMSQTTIASYLDGSFERTFAPTGMRAVIDLSLEKVTGQRLTTTISE